MIAAQLAWATVVTGGIGSSTIEIDSPADASGNVSAPGADLFPGAGKDCSNATFPTSGSLDWVADCNANPGTGTLSGGIATGLIAGTTAASPICATTPASFPATCATGHWNGVRIVDGVSGNDQDIFTKGGKENDVTSWTVAPGTVGSSKYDASQMYLANNQTDVYFGMERIGNNGTTAFDFEFNKNPPKNPGASTACTGTCYFPDRSVDDVLLTFEFQGSGSSGSAVIHYFTWSGSAYVEHALPAGAKISVNDAASTAGEPWGHVDSKGNWVLGALDRFTSAEADVPLTLLGISGSACNTTRFVEIRTRSSSTDTSDLKDTTPEFTYSFGGPHAAASLSTSCATVDPITNPNGNPTFTYDGAGSTTSAGGSAGLAYGWSLDVSPTTATLSGGGATATATAGHYTSSQPNGTVTVNLPTGVSSAVITVVNTVSEGGCPDSTGSKVVTVYRALRATATLTPHCNNTFDFTSTVSGGNAPYTYSWVFQKNSSDDGSGTWSTFPISGGASFTSGSATSPSGTISTGVKGAFRGVLTVTDTAGTCGGGDCAAGVTPKGICTATATSPAINVYDAVGGTVALTPSCGSTFTYLTTPSGGKGPYTYAYTLEKFVTGIWQTSSSWTAGPSSTNSGTIDIDNPVSAPAGTNPGGNLNPAGPGHYRLRVTISDSQTPACTFSTTSNEIDVRDALTVSIAKNSTNTSNMSVTVNSTVLNAFGDTITYSWSKSTDNVTFTPIASSNTANLTYSSFETDDTSPDSQSFTIGSDQYNGKVYVVYLKVTISRTLNGNLCTATSNTVAVKKVVAVDP